VKIKIDLRYGVFFIFLAVVYVLVFIAPGKAGGLALDPSAEGEWWRFLTYQFIHLNWQHLLQNIVTLGLVSFIAIELRTKFKFFSINYLLAGLVAILPLWIISPFVALGASAAIYGAFGMISPEARQFKINVFLVILVIAGFIFIKPLWLVFSGGEFDFVLKQSLAHFSGFVFGLAGFYVFYLLDRFLLKRKQSVLRRVK